MDLSARIADLVKAARGHDSLRHASTQSGISYSTLHRMESGWTPDLTTLVRLLLWTGADANLLLLGHDGEGKACPRCTHLASILGAVQTIAATAG